MIREYLMVTVQFEMMLTAHSKTSKQPHIPLSNVNQFLKSHHQISTKTFDELTEKLLIAA